MRSLSLVVFIFLLGAASGGGLTWMKTEKDASEMHRLQQLVQLRSDENDRLRGILTAQERANALAKNQAQREAIEKQVTAIRGLNFDHPVEFELLTRKGIKDVVTEKLSETFSEEDFAHISATLSRLGLLPPNYPLRKKYIDLLGEQIAAFYDQHHHKLFMFEDATLDNSQNCIVLAHELTHALQDQHFNLLGLPLEIKDDDDRAEAASALVEGEATVVMSDYMMRNLSLKTLKDNLATSLSQNMNQLADAPPYLRETLVFPYLRGQEFCAALMDRGGYNEISKAFAHLPQSTSQILHPEKYLSNPPEEPLAIDWSDTAFEGQKPAQDNVLGELGVRILLGDLGNATAAEATAAGWRGDRYLWFEKGDALVWKSVWSSAASAERFFEAERQSLTHRYHPEQPRDVDPDKEFAADTPRALRLVRLPANTVLLVDASDPAAAARMVSQFGH